MKIFLVTANENWFCDRMSDEFCKENKDIVTTDINEADIIWVLTAWTWKDIPLDLLKSKKVVVTIHHVVPNKFNEHDFLDRDKYVDAYHVPSKYTKKFIENHTNKPINLLGYWANPDMWFELEKNEIRNELSLPNDKFLIGSFQRDTEGHDLITPKLEKGPDIFCDMVINYSQVENVEVVLAGWRRQYVISRLEQAGIKYHYFELPSFEMINKLYNVLDLYIVGARYEGGPQSLLECALSKTPIISTDVGMASEILSDESIFGNKEYVNANTEVTTKKIQKYIIPKYFEDYRNFFKEVF